MEFLHCIVVYVNTANDNGERLAFIRVKSESGGFGQLLGNV